MPPRPIRKFALLPHRDRLRVEHLDPALPTHRSHLSAVYAQIEAAERRAAAKVRASARLPSGEGHQPPGEIRDREILTRVMRLAGMRNDRIDRVLPVAFRLFEQGHHESVEHPDFVSHLLEAGEAGRHLKPGEIRPLKLAFRDWRRARKFIGDKVNRRRR